MAMPEHAASMLQMARRDHDALAAMVDLPQVADSIYGFHAQQAVEKALKAWLALRGLQYPLTHDLPRLLSLKLERGCRHHRPACTRWAGAVLLRCYRRAKRSGRRGGRRV